VNSFYIALKYQHDGNVASVEERDFKDTYTVFINDFEHG
jgi:hypothetical protein